MPLFLSWLGLIRRPVLASSIEPVFCEGSVMRGARGLMPRLSSFGVSADSLPGSSGVGRGVLVLRSVTLRFASRGQAGLVVGVPVACLGGRARAGGMTNVATAR